MQARAQPKVEIEGIHGSVTITRRTPGVVVARFVGKDVGEFGDVPFRELDADLAVGPVQLFVDARDSKGPSLDVSDAWMQWFRRNASRIHYVCVLTGSPYVQLTAGMIQRFSELGEKFRIYTEASAFEAAIEVAARSARHVR